VAADAALYAATWRAARAMAARLPDRSGEYVLNVYPALSLLGLLVLWLAGLMIGWALVYWGLDQHVGGTRDWGTLVYYAGTSLVTRCSVRRTAHSCACSRCSRP
jgi:hypothetical protein